MAGLLILNAQPAEAKCVSVERVMITGREIAPALELTREQWGVPRNERSATAVVIEGLLGRYPKDAVPPRRLGPRYGLLYLLEILDFRTDGTRIEVVEQELYPRTSAGPMTFTPPQSWTSCTGRSEEISPGWQPFPRELVERLGVFGLRRAAGLAPESREASNTAVWAALGAAAIVVCAAGGLCRRSRRRRFRN